jgi:hypothetical protein
VSVRDKLASIIKSSIIPETTFRMQLDKLGIQVLHDEWLAKRINILAELHNIVIQRVTEQKTEASPEGRLKIIKMKLETVDNILRRAAVPWGRGGSRRAFAKFMEHYEILYARAREYVNAVKDLMKLKGTGEHLGSQNAASSEAEEVSDTQTQTIADEEWLNDRSPTAWRRTPPKYAFARRLIDKSEVVRILENFLDREVFPYALLLIDISFLDPDVTPGWSITLRRPEEPATWGRPPPARTRAGESEDIMSAKVAEQIEALKREMRAMRGE